MPVFYRRSWDLPYCSNVPVVASAECLWAALGHMSQGILSAVVGPILNMSGNLQDQRCQVCLAALGIRGDADLSGQGANRLNLKLVWSPKHMTLTENSCGRYSRC